MLRAGTYELEDGTKVTVRTTRTGYTITYPDGTVTAVSAGVS